MLVGAATAARRGMSRPALAMVFFGGLLPDLSVFAMVIWSRLTGYEGNLWRQPVGLYWQEPWQTLSAISNSFPLYAVGLILAYMYWRRAVSPIRPWALGLFGLFGAALMHVLLDFPVHTTDAHVHFWPFTDWRFQSPVSYYQRSAHGEIVSLVEMVFGLTAALALWWRFKGLGMRIALVLLCLPYLLRLLPFSLFRYLF